MAMWSPWRGCRKCSEGCRFCYIHKGDAKRGINTGEIVKTDKFYAPIEKKKNGESYLEEYLQYTLAPTYEATVKNGETVLKGTGSGTGQLLTSENFPNDTTSMTRAQLDGVTPSTIVKETA